jgi:hypothetical protein
MLSAAFAVFVLLTPAFAQTGAMQVSVPFAFTVGKQTLPAGDYRVTIGGAAILKLACINGSGFSYALTNYVGGGPNENMTPRLVFHAYGSSRFLSEAWTGGTNMGHQLSTSRAEVEFARDMRPNKTVILASRMNPR